MRGEQMQVNSQQAVLCPQCSTKKVDFVFLPQGGAECVECHDAKMVDVVSAWRNGEVQAALAEGLEQYISGGAR